jgi:hypothetical protein
VSSNLKILSSDDLHKLGRSRIKAWRAIRAYSPDVWKRVTKQQLTKESGLKERSFERAVSTLLKLGVIERYNSDPVTYFDDNWNKKFSRKTYYRSLYMVGTAPINCWLTLEPSLKYHGGSRPRSGAPNKDEKQMQKDGHTKKEIAIYRRKRFQDDALYNNSSTLYSYSVSSCPTDKKRRFDESSNISSKEEKSRLGTILHGSASLSQAPLPPEFLQTLPSIEAAPKLSTSHQIIHASTPTPVRVRSMLAAYNHAVKELYGARVHPWGNVEKLKMYQRLVASADIFVTEEVSPMAWALWWMPKLKHHWPDKPPPASLVFSATTLKKRLGWFVRTDDSGGLKYQVTRSHIEQMLRRKEAELRYRGASDEDVFYRGFPTWYADMRAEEMRTGFNDPISCWPRIVK